MDLEHCDIEIREALFEALRARGSEDRHRSRLARLKGRLGL